MRKDCFRQIKPAQVCHSSIPWPCYFHQFLPLGSCPSTFSQWWTVVWKPMPSPSPASQKRILHLLLLTEGPDQDLTLFELQFPPTQNRRILFIELVWGLFCIVNGCTRHDVPVEVRGELKGNSSLLYHAGSHNGFRSSDLVANTVTNWAVVLTP